MHVRCDLEEGLAGVPVQAQDLARAGLGEQAPAAGGDQADSFILAIPARQLPGPQRQPVVRVPGKQPSRAVVQVALVPLHLFQVEELAAAGADAVEAVGNLAARPGLPLGFERQLPLGRLDRLAVDGREAAGSLGAHFQRLGLGREALRRAPERDEAVGHQDPAQVGELGLAQRGGVLDDDQVEKVRAVVLRVEGGVADAKLLAVLEVGFGKLRAPQGGEPGVGLEHLDVKGALGGKRPGQRRVLRADHQAEAAFDAGLLEERGGVLVCCSGAGRGNGQQAGREQRAGRRHLRQAFQGDSCRCHDLCLLLAVGLGGLTSPLSPWPPRRPSRRAHRRAPGHPSRSQPGPRRRRPCSRWA